MPFMNYTGFELAGVYFTGPEIWRSGNTDLAIYSHFVCVKRASQMWLYYPEFQLLCRYTYTAANQFSQAQSQLISQLHGLTCIIFSIKSLITYVVWLSLNVFYVYIYNHESH